MFINLTPHDVTIELSSGERVVFPKSGNVARVSTQTIAQEPIDGIPTVKTIYGDVTGLPEPEDGVVYIVSLLVAQQARRDDVVSPDSGPSAIRDEKGQIVAVRALVRQ